MPREKTILVYKFDELSEEAKDRAKQHHAELFGYSWADDAMKSLKALAEHFGGKLSNYEIDWFATSPSFASFDMPEDVDAEEIAGRLQSLGTYDATTLKGHGDCKLTGFCADDDAIDGFRRAYHAGERDLNKLMQAAFKTWLAAAQDDCEGQYENDEFSETADANNWEYDEQGDLA